MSESIYRRTKKGIFRFMEVNGMVSVIITNYNYGIYLRDAVESVLKQTYDNFELLIADDGSTDESR